MCWPWDLRETSRLSKPWSSHLEKEDVGFFDGLVWGLNGRTNEVCLLWCLAHSRCWGGPFSFPPGDTGSSQAEVSCCPFSLALPCGGEKSGKGAAELPGLFVWGDLRFSAPINSLTQCGLSQRANLTGN